MLAAAPAPITDLADPVRFHQFWPLWQFHVSHCGSCASGALPLRCANGLVIAALLRGFRLPLASSPPPIQLPPYRSAAAVRGADELVRELVSAGFVRPLGRSHPRVPLHPLGLIVKGYDAASLDSIPSGAKSRLVLDLSRCLNRHLLDWPFSYVGLPEVASLVPESWYVSTCDLQKFFLHIPVHPDHAVLQAFSWGANRYHYTGVAFGIKCGPVLASLVSAVLVDELRYAGVPNASCFVDDLVLWSSSAGQARAHLRTALARLEAWGFPPARDKTQSPSRRPVYLGAQLCTSESTLRIPAAKRAKYSATFAALAAATSVTKRGLQKVAGTASYLASLLPQLRVAAAPFFAHLRRVGAPWQSRRVAADLREAAVFWLDALATPAACLTPLPRPTTPTVMVRSDASGTRGFYLTSRLGTFSAAWDELWSGESSVAKEVFPMLAFLARWGRAVAGHLVVFHTDCAAAVSALNSGRCAEPLATHLAGCALTLAATYGAVVVAVWTPRELIADCDAGSKSAILTLAALAAAAPRAATPVAGLWQAVQAVRDAPLHPDGTARRAAAAAEAGEALLGHLAPATRLTYERTLVTFVEFCKARDFPPDTADPGVVQSFLLAWLRDHKATAAASVVTALTQAARAHGLPVLSDPARAEVARLAAAVRRRRGDAVSRKHPITLELLDRVLLHLDLEHDPAALQFWLMAIMSHQGMLRSRELLTLRWADVVIKSDAVVIYISCAKTHAEPRPVVYARRSDRFCVHRHLLAYRSTVAPGALLFPALSFPGGRPAPAAHPVSYSAWRSAVQARLAAAGVPGHLVGTHSFRAGGCTDYLRSGAPDSFVLRQGRWASTAAFAIYDRPSLRGIAAMSAALPAPDGRRASGAR